MNRSKRIGLILPSLNVTMEPEFYRMVPQDFTVHSTRLLLKQGSPEEFEAMDRHTEEAAELLATAQVDVITYGCTAGGIIKGEKLDEGIIRRIEKHTGTPATTTSRSVIEALHHLGARRMAVATPYDDSLNRKVKTYCEEKGLQVLNIAGMGYSKGGEWRKETANSIHDFALKACRKDADALFISCTDLPTISLISDLEAALKKPVVSSNSASMWGALKKIEYQKPIMGYGQLLRGLGSLRAQPV